MATPAGTKVTLSAGKLEPLIREENHNCTQLGILLKIPSVRLKALERQSNARKSAKEYFQDVCHKWLNSSKDRKWSEVYVALEMIGYRALKANLEEKYRADTTVDLDLGDFTNELKITAEWKMFGIALGLAVEDLDIRDDDGSQRYMIAILKEWMDSEGEKATWEALQEALRSPLIGNRRLAADLEEHRLKDKQAALVDADTAQEAIEQEVEMRVSNLVVYGSPGSGKTCVVKLSVGEPAPEDRNSTGCIEAPVRSIAQGTIFADGTRLKRLKTDEMLNMACQAMKHKVDKIKSQQADQKKPHHEVPSSSPEATRQSSSTPSMSDGSTEAITSDDDEEEGLQVFDKLVAEISSVEASTDFLTAHLVLTIDSGGQPHFMDVAPLFLRNGSLFLITVKLNERLDSKPKFAYYIDGQEIEMSKTELQPTNLELIVQIAKSISSLQLSTTLSDESENAKYMIVGTFADKAVECSESVPDKNSKLRDQLKDYEAERIDAGNDVIFAVNAIIKDQVERRAAALKLQDKITNTPGTTIKTRIRLRWFGLLLHLLDEAEKNEVSAIQLKNVLAAGKKLQMNRDETLQAIAFFHELNLLMYFSTDKLGNIVFIDVKPILSKVSNLIGISFIDKDKLMEIFPKLPADAQDSLKRYGRFSREILKSFHFSGLLTADVFLDLLEHLCVIARIEKNGQTCFFLPCALLHAPEDILKKKEQHTSLWIVTLQTRRNTVLVDVPIPKGYLPTLVVCLLNLPNFEADLKNCQYRNLMSICLYGKGHVYLIERSLQLEIYYSCAGNDEEMGKNCSFIRSAILNALIEVEKKLHFRPDILIKNDAFLCSCDGFRLCRRPRHICVYYKESKRTECSITKKMRKINQKQQYWLHQPDVAVDSSSQSQPSSLEPHEPSCQISSDDGLRHRPINNSPATPSSSDDRLRHQYVPLVNNNPPATRGYTLTFNCKLRNIICGVFLILIMLTMGFTIVYMYTQLPKNGRVDLVADLTVERSTPEPRAEQSVYTPTVERSTPEPRYIYATTVEPSTPEPRTEQSTISDNCHPISEPTDVFLFLKEEFEINKAKMFGLLLKLTNSELVRIKEDCKHEQAVMFLNDILVAWHGKTSPPACWETIYDALWELPNRPLANKVKQQYLK